MGAHNLWRTEYPSRDGYQQGSITLVSVQKTWWFVDHLPEISSLHLHPLGALALKKKEGKKKIQVTESSGCWLWHNQQQEFSRLKQQEASLLVHLIFIRVVQFLKQKFCFAPKKDLNQDSYLEARFKAISLSQSLCGSSCPRLILLAHKLKLSFKSG